ncbi:MAG: molybdopterin cofactor-binding domain-containing protein [Bacteroidia bacterium]
MTQAKNTINRRKFLKASALAGGGFMLSYGWLTGCEPSVEEALTLPEEWFNLNSYIRIGANGVVNLMSPNPEFGSNVKTSMPMILAEELDVEWKKVVVEQADFYPERFDRQFTGGSQGIRQGWKPLRTAGATARQMLKNAAAKTWNVPAEEITTEAGVLYHNPTGKKAGYGEMAAMAATLPVPENVTLKEVKDFRVIGTSRKNVDGKKIVTGEPLFTMDHKVEGMLVAAVTHPPFGMRPKSVDDSVARAMPGIKDIFTIRTLEEGYERNFFDTNSFNELVVVVGNSTWEVMNAQKSLNIEWEQAKEESFTVKGWGNTISVTVPTGLESTSSHEAKMAEMANKPGTVLRKDGDPEGAFKKATKILERTYSAPYLAHNCMEPANCFAHVTADRAEIYGPIQAPESIMQTLSARLGMPKENIHIRLARMGGGFGQRAYGHHMVEAAVISQKVNAPVKMLYTREQDMTNGIYRPTYTATYRAGLDENNNLIAFHVKGGGIPENAVHANRFPAGAVDNYLAEGWQITSNISIGAFRAPRSNFIAGAEQSFLDELAEMAGKDPIDFRLELLERAKTNPVGANNDYDADRYAGVLKLVREKSKWDETKENAHRGVAAYFCHNTYVAEVLDLVVEKNNLVFERVYAAVDCGIVINPDAAVNMGEGGIVDGIGNALFGEMTFADGVPAKNNFHQYRMIRQKEAPKAIEVHFVENDYDPTGLGEPLFPPVFAAVANALYKATGRRYYSQPFAKDIPSFPSKM